MPWGRSQLTTLSNDSNPMWLTQSALVVNLRTWRKKKMQKMASTSLKVGEKVLKHQAMLLYSSTYCTYFIILLFFILYHYLHNFHSLGYFLQYFILK